MNFASEREFEIHIRSLLQEHLLARDNGLFLFDSKKAVDVLLYRNGINPAVYFIEIKYHKLKHGRLGTGHGKGGGFQPEILSKTPDYFQSNMRWILGSEDQDGYYLLTNDQIKKYVANGNIGQKYNNIQKRLFTEHQQLNEQELINELSSWLLTPSMPVQLESNESI